MSWSTLSLRYPPLLLLLPFLSGYLLGPAAPAAWTLIAAFPRRARERPPGGGWMVMGLVPLVMAAAGALEAGALPARDPGPVGPILVRGVILEGPWPEGGYRNGWSLEVKPRRPAGFPVLHVRARGSVRPAVAPGDRVRFPARLMETAHGRRVDTRAELIRREGSAPLPSVLLRPAFRARLRMRRGLEESLDREAAGLAGAFVLGLKDGVDPRLKAAFRRTGTAHLLAVSGLHVGLVAAAAAFLLSAAGLKGTPRFLASLPVLAAFAILSGRRPPVLRAALVCALHFHAARAHRPVDPFLPLFHACLVLVLLDPAVIRSPSFQLSFAGYGSILLFLALRRRAWGLSGRPRPPGERPRLLQRAAGPAKKLFLAAGVSLASWLGTLPLVLHYFHTFNPFTPLANLLLIPLFAPALAAGTLHAAAAWAGLHRSALTALPAQESLHLFASTLRFLDRLLPPPLKVPPLSGAGAAGVYLLGLAGVSLLLRGGKGRYKGEGKC